MADCDACGAALPVQTGRGGRRKRHPGCVKRPQPRGLVASTQAAVDRWKVGHLPLAASALLLARQVDRCGVDQFASLHRELRLTLAELETLAAPDEGDAVTRAQADLRLVQ